MSYDKQLEGRRHFHRGAYQGANAAVMSRISFPYDVIIRSISSTVVTAHDTAGAGWVLRDADGAPYAGAAIDHYPSDGSADTAGVVRSVKGLSIKVPADTEVQIYGTADADVGKQEICIEYELPAGQMPHLPDTEK